MPRESQTTRRTPSAQGGTPPDDRHAKLVALYTHYHRSLRAYCTRFLNDAETARDVAQEIWERVLRLLASDRVLPDDPTALLLTIARNLCLDVVKQTRPHATLDDVPEERLPVVAQPEPSYHQELLRIALPRLREPYRRLLELYLAGYSYEEIAAMRGEPISTVKMRAWRARAALRRIIEPLTMNDDG